MQIQVFNADDHPILRKGITELITQTPDLKWVGSAENGQEALDKIKAIQPDVAILDIEMPHMTGLAVAQSLIEEGIKTKFILLTLFKDPSFLKSAIATGIMGYLLKESSEKEILECIHSVYNGKAYVNASMTQHLITAKNTPETNVLANLSDHEVNILKLISKQKTSSEIADMLFISPKPVSNHRTNISKKLNLNGIQNGLLKWAIGHRDLLT